MSYENILVETRGDGAVRTGLITLNRPKALNALNDGLMDELGAALKAFDADAGIGAIVITGSDKAFAAGADIGVLAQHNFVSAYTGDLITRNWETIRAIRKPVIAAVAGFALGGGCEDPVAVGLEALQRGSGDQLLTGAEEDADVAVAREHDDDAGTVVGVADTLSGDELGRAR